MILDKKKILEYQQKRDPYHMFDYVEDVVAEKYAIGYKKLNADEWFFKVHWASDPNMPAMLQTEAMVQMAAMSLLTYLSIKEKWFTLLQHPNCNLRKKFYLTQS